MDSMATNRSTHKDTFLYVLHPLTDQFFSQLLVLISEKMVKHRVVCWYKKLNLLLMTSEFFLNVFTKFADFSDKIFVITVNGLEPTTSCVRDPDATTAPARHMCFSDDQFP